MSWNRPSGNQRTRLSKNVSRTKWSAGIGGLLLVGCVAVGTYFCWRGNAFVGEDEQAKSHFIKDAGAAKSLSDGEDLDGGNGTGRKGAKPASATITPTNKPWRASCEGVGWINGVYHSPDPQFEAKKKVLDALDARQNPFRYESETAISSVVNSGVGGFIFPQDFGPAFVADFLRSLREPIVISQDDPEDVQERKRNVRDAKIYLKEQYDKGEDIGKIMQKAVDEINRLSELHDDYAEQLTELKMRGASRQEIEDLVTAANMILKEKGALPLNMPVDTSKFHFRKGKK